MGSILKIKGSDCFEETKKKVIEDHPSHKAMLARQAAEAQAAQAQSLDLFAEDELNQAMSQSRWDLVEALVTEEEGAPAATSNLQAKSPIETEIGR
jgi:cellobiose-specific phosphotransferase system component IIA